MWSFLQNQNQGLRRTSIFCPFSSAPSCSQGLKIWHRLCRNKPWKMETSYGSSCCRLVEGGISGKSQPHKAGGTMHPHCSHFHIVVGSPSLLLQFQVVKIIIIPQQMPRPELTGKHSTNKVQGVFSEGRDTGVKKLAEGTENASCTGRLGWKSWGIALLRFISAYQRLKLEMQVRISSEKLT